MVYNESFRDRAIRIGLGVCLIAMAFVEPKTPWGLIGLVPLVTGLVGVCPIYKALGISTEKASRYPTQVTS